MIGRSNRGRVGRNRQFREFSKPPLHKIANFGLARETATDAAGADLPTLTQLTMAGNAVGTPAYMSPEQLRGLHVDSRTDIFALGVVLYEMLAGRRPFDAPSHADSVLRVLITPPHALARLNYAVPEALERIVRKCLEKDPDWRYQSARELAIDLGSVQRDSDSGILPAVSAGAAGVAPPAPAAPKRRGLAAWWTAGVTLALAVSIGGYLLATRPRTIDSIAILPFVNASGTTALDYAADGLSDAVQRGLTGRIIARFEDKGLTVAGMKLLRIPTDLAERHYAPHKGKPFYPGLIEYITSFMALLPGDMIMTGTPEGVGKLAPGDVVEVEVEGVGTLANTVR